jgi:superfamily II DNA or RNA helicase
MVFWVLAKAEIVFSLSWVHIMELVETHPASLLCVHLFTYLSSQREHHVVPTCAVFDVPSLCKATVKDLKTFIEVNCTPDDRAHLNVSSMTKTDLLRHATAMMIPRGTSLPVPLAILLTPYASCSEEALLMFAERQQLLPKSASLTIRMLLRHLVTTPLDSGRHQPVLLTKPSERCRRNVTEQCLHALRGSFQGARFEEECGRFLDWTIRDALAHAKPRMLSERILWLQALDIPIAKTHARYLTRHVVPFLVARRDVILSHHGCWEALRVDRKLQRTNVAKCGGNKAPQAEGYFQRILWTDDSQLREPQRLALEALRRESFLAETVVTQDASTEYEALIALRAWFARVLYATFSGHEPPLRDGDPLFASIRKLQAKLSAIPFMVVLPTGVGKSAVMCLAPFVAGPCRPRRVMVVCPNVAIRKQLTTCFRTFYGQRVSLQESPKVAEISGDWNYQSAHDQDHDVFVVTFHKLTGNALIASYPRCFFDLILVDEAHHAEALTYRLLREHFCDAHFVYFTGTPYRADRVPIQAKLVYSCTMREALQHNPPCIKRLCYLPLPVRSLTLRSHLSGETRHFNSFVEVVQHADVIGRGGALRRSLEASGHVIGFAIWKLKQMRRVSGVQHQALLQASDSSEAEFLTSLWNAHPENRCGDGSPRLTIAVIHSGMPQEDVQNVIQRLKLHEVDALVHVGMIGEGFDHPYLSLCCIFKRFVSIAPVVQLLGRVLRAIPGVGAAGNDAFVIAHPALGFAKCWELYKEERHVPDDAQLQLRSAESDTSSRYDDLEETSSFDNEMLHADWFS